MIRKTEILNYRFYDEVSDAITENHNLERFSVFDDEKKCIGIKLLQDETMKHLKFYFENDYTGVLLYLESLRFLPYILHNQTISYNLFDTYYENILKFFHSKDLLLFKQNYKPYKVFFKKKPYALIDLTYNNVKIKVRYMSYNDLKEDFGRYKANQIVKYSYNLSYEELIRIILE